MIYELHTNEGRMFVTCAPSFEEQMAYIRSKLKQGWKLSEVMYCWGPVIVSHRGPGYALMTDEDKQRMKDRKQRDEERRKERAQRRKDLSTR
jgi:hypothetical protein